MLRIVTLASKRGRYGGPYDTARLQAGSVQSLGIDITLLAGILRDDRPTEPNLDSVFVPVFKRLPLPGFAGLISIRMIRSLFAEIRRSDVIHLSISRETIPVVALLFAHILRKPIALQPHGMLTSRSSRAHRLFDAFLRPLTASKRTMWIALTSVEAEQLRNWARRPLRILRLGNPIAVADSKLEELRNASKTEEAVFIARLHPRKRVQDFISAAEYAYEQNWGDRYVVIGPDQGDLGSLQRRLADIPLLNYEGTLSGNEIPKRLSQSGVFVLPSVNEPWGNVLATALAIHTPVVVTASAALAHSVQQMGAGLVVPDRDPIRIAEAVHEILSGKDGLHRNELMSPVLSNTQIGERLQHLYTMLVMPGILDNKLS